jgi:hypothetical protein
MASAAPRVRALAGALKLLLTLLLHCGLTGLEIVEGSGRGI